MLLPSLTNGNIDANLFGAFATRSNLQDSILRAYEYGSAALTEVTGLTGIRTMFESFFALLTSCELLTMPVMEVTEEPKQVFLVWDCPDSGVVSATDTFLYRSGDYKNMVQVGEVFASAFRLLWIDLADDSRLGHFNWRQCLSWLLWIDLSDDSRLGHFTWSPCLFRLLWIDLSDDS